MFVRKAIANLNVRSLVRSSTGSFYDSRTKNDTIFAVATSINPKNGSPLGVIRVSGPKTGSILKDMTKREPTGPTDLHADAVKPLSKNLKARQATLTKILEPTSRELIDMGLVIWFPKPSSYTGEDVCEFHLHGSQAIITKMLNTLGSVVGLRPAEPGEFTRRAVMNGKMSLMQAESLPDLIRSNTDNQRRLALNGLDGSTRKKYDLWTEQLVNILAHLEASIDFGEDELIGEEAVVNNCLEKLRDLSARVAEFIKVSSRCRDFINDGATIAILGKPNAGKSTFMNLLCGRDLSIVSDLSGTTRDLVRHSFELSGHSVTLCDTAGLKNFSNLIQDHEDESSSKALLGKHHSIEREGIKRALEAAKTADILIYIIDGSTLGVCEQQKLVEIGDELDTYLEIICGSDPTSKRKLIHLVVNKLDLNSDLKCSDYMMHLENMVKTKSKHIHNLLMSQISCKTQENFDQLLFQLTECIDEMCSASTNNSSDYGGPVQFDYINQRHLSLLRSVHKHLELASNMDMSTIDQMAQHIRESVDYLSRIVGSISNDNVIDIIFKDFCIGK